MTVEAEDGWDPAEEAVFRREMFLMVFGVVVEFPAMMTGVIVGRRIRVIRFMAADAVRKLDESGALALELARLAREIASNGGLRRGPAVDPEQPPPPDPVTVGLGGSKYRAFRLALGVVALVPTTILRACCTT